MRAGDEVVEVDGIDVNGDPDRLVSLIAPQNSPKALLQIKVSLSCIGSFVGCAAFEAHTGGEREMGGVRKWSGATCIIIRTAHSDTSSPAQVRSQAREGYANVDLLRWPRDHMDRYAALDDLLQVHALLVDTETKYFGIREVYAMSWRARGVLC